MNEQQIRHIVALHLIDLLPYMSVEGKQKTNDVMEGMTQELLLELKERKNNVRL